MKRVFLSMCLGAACSVASASNVILEWGAHSSPDEYEIFDDLYVVIHANTTPGPWKFEAWDTVTGEEGVIDSITIVSAEPVTGIDLRIAPDPDSPYGAHLYGAANLKHLDVLSNGDASNRLTTLLLRNDYGDIDPASGGTLSVGQAGTLQIGGNVVAPAGVNAIDISGPVNGAVTITGDVQSPVHVQMVWGPVTMGNVGAAVSLGGVSGTMTVGGQISAPFTCNWNAGDAQFTYAGSHTAAITLWNVPAGHTFTCNGHVPGLTIITIEENALAHLAAGAGQITFGAARDNLIAGTLFVDGDVGSLGSANIGDTGAVSVTGSLGNWSMAARLRGDVTLGGVSGSVTCPYGLSGRLYINTLSGFFIANTTDAQITIDHISAGGTLAGSHVRSTLSIGELSAGGTFSFGSFTGGSLSIGQLAGTLLGVEFGGADPPFAGPLSVTEYMSGRILLNGGLAHNPGLPPGTFEVQIADKSEDALFVVNNDGVSCGQDNWEGVVQVGSTQYAAQEPGINLWCASCIVCDVNSDGQVNGYDIDPLVQLIADGDGYCAAYPGMCDGTAYDPDLGSVLYRGDANCDGAINGYDIDAFTLKLTNPEQWSQQYWCEICVCPGELLELEGGLAERSLAEGVEGEPAPASPEDVAALLASSVAPERLGMLTEITEMLAADLPDPERAEFWAEVAALLPE